MSWRYWLVLLIIGVAVGGCVDTYSQEELREGVPLKVDDPEGLIETAELIDIFQRPDKVQLSVELSEDIYGSSTGVIVVDPGIESYEVVVAYRTGCMGVVPAVSASSDDSNIVIDVESKLSDWRSTCASAEIDEAIGINFTASRDDRPVVANHAGPQEF